jgi:hypothetical protein
MLHLMCAIYFPPLELVSLDLNCLQILSFLLALRFSSSYLPLLISVLPVSQARAKSPIFSCEAFRFQPVFISHFPNS